MKKIDIIIKDITDHNGMVYATKLAEFLNRIIEIPLEKLITDEEKEKGKPNS